MVARYKTVLMDDLDNETEAIETVRITRNGETREVDLGKRNLNRYVEKIWTDARKVTPGSKGTRVVAAVPTSNSNKVDNAAIRAWARSRDIPVTERGRLPKSIVDQYTEYEKNRSVVG